MASVKTSRNKGKAFERLIAKRFSRVFGIKLGRTQSSGALDIKGDIRPVMDENGVMPYFEWVIECKNQKNTQIPAWVRQLEEEEKANNKKGMIVFHVHSSNRNMIIMRKEISAQEMYPSFVTESGKVETIKPTSEDAGKHIGDIVKSICLNFELYGKHLRVDMGEYEMFNIETFELLYKYRKNSKIDTEN